MVLVGRFYIAKMKIVFSQKKVNEITEIIHSEFFWVDQWADLFTSKICFRSKNSFIRAKNKTPRKIGKIIKIYIV